MALRAFVEDLRLKKFGIGSREANPLAQDFHEAIRNLSEGLYQKDIHFLLEILQNAEDNSYPKWVPPSLEIILTDKDITETGASGTLVFFNNEVGFSEKNIEALCSIGRSTKKGNKAEGYIGEKGIGFKSVFLVSGRPHIISNGFRIRFHDEPSNEARLGYVVPEWTEKPTDEDLALLYGSRNIPSTVVVLPLRQGKIESVSKQLAQISPKSLLFLSKLSKLSVEDKLQGKKTTLSRTVEASGSYRLRENCQSSTSVLSVESHGRSKESSYYIFTEKFMVPDSCKVAGRNGVDEWTISLAFPFEDVVWPSEVGSTDGNVFSFLPTEVQSQLPFLINADFILTSSREAIAWENIWNQGILSHIPWAFCDAFENLVTFGGQSSIGTASMYQYIPTSRACPSLEKVRLDIIENLNRRQIVLCASEVLDENDKQFCLASDARTVIRTFRDILKQAINMNIRSPLVGGKLKFVNQFVQETQTSALFILNVQNMSVSEYIDLMPLWWIKMLPDELYAKVLSFLAFDLQICKRYSRVCKAYKFLKYKDNSSGEIKYASILDRECAANEPICLSSGDQKFSWLSPWADVLSGWITFHVMTEEFLSVVNEPSYSRLLTWLRSTNLNVISITTESFAEKLVGVAKQNHSQRLALISMHFFFDMEQKGLLVNISLKGKLPLLDCLGCLHLDTSDKEIFLPPSLSKWPVLMKPKTWEDFVTKLSDQYLEGQCAMVDLSSMDTKKSFRLFLERNLNAIDILELYPLNQSFPTEKLAIKEAVMLFLDWISNTLKKLGYLPRKFFNSIVSSCWVSTDHGPKRPSQSFLLVDEIKKFFVSGDLPFVDTEYYGCLSHRHEWEAIGVNIDPSKEECYKAAIAHFQFLMTSHASEMCADKATRFYTYFSGFKQSQNLDNLLSSIWIPKSLANSSPSWAATNKCLISDEDGLFETKYSILGTFYNSKQIKSFFRKLGVPLKPRMDHYCNLWLDWTKEVRNVTEWECLKTWTVLAAEDCFSLRKSTIWSKFLKHASIPSTLMGKKENPMLLHPSTTLVPDDVEMEHLFQASSHPPPMAWYPTRSRACNLSTLFSIYNSMGAQNLSECVQSEIDMSSASTSQDISSDILWPIQSLVSSELSKLVMGLISKELSSHERKKILLPLLTAKEMVMNEGFKVKHSLCIGEQTFTTSSEVLVFWEKSSNIIYYVERGQLKDAVSRMMFNQHLAKAISHGLLSERREMAEDLQEKLSAANLCDLDNSAVAFMLRKMNIRVCEEDMSFIHSKRLEDAPSTKLEEDGETSTPLETLTKISNNSDEDELEVNAVSKTVEQSLIESSYGTSLQGEDTQMCIDLERLVTQANISNSPVTPTFISTSKIGGAGSKKRRGYAAISRRSNPGNSTNKKLRLELLHEIRGALLGEGKKTPIAIDVSVEPALGWSKAQLLSVRHFLGYPPELGSVKRGMRVKDLQGDPFDLDKYLFLAFAHPMISTNDQFDTMHERLTTLGHACLNMWITCEVLDKHPEENMSGIIGKKEKMMSKALCSTFLRASQLNMCIVGADSCDDPKILSDVFMAIMDVGYLCYECDLDEVRRLYLEMFVESLEACEATI